MSENLYVTAVKFEFDSQTFCLRVLLVLYYVTYCA